MPEFENDRRRVGKRTEMYDDDGHVEITFEEENLSAELRYAQRAEFKELEGIIEEHFGEKMQPLSVLDVGIGNARVLRRIADKQALLQKVRRYQGIDVAQNCVDISMIWD